MKKSIILRILVLSITTGLSAQDMPFVFDKSRIDVGAMYVYEYSKNKEDFEPVSKRYFYIKTFDDIEIIWIPLKAAKATLLERFKMNWDYMMFEKIEYLSLKNKDEIPIGATIKGTYEHDFSKNISKSHYINRAEDGIEEAFFNAKFRDIPTYFYKITDLIPLWFVLRFYPLEREKISVGHSAGSYNTRFDIKYMGKEEVEVPYGRVLCHKFELVNEMSLALRILFRPKKAWIWLTSKDDTRYMVKYRNNNIRSTFTRTMEYRLAEVKKMTSEEWEEFKEKHGAQVVIKESELLGE